jgi:hypothetical protein
MVTGEGALGTDGGVFLVGQIIPVEVSVTAEA